MASVHVTSTSVLDHTVLQRRTLAEARNSRDVSDVCRAAAAGALAIGSKAAFMLKGAGGASGLLKGAGVLAAAGANLRPGLLLGV